MRSCIQAGGNSGFGAEEAATVLSPGPLARLVAAAGRRDRVAALQLRRQRVPGGRGPRSVGPFASFPADFNHGCSKRQDDKPDRAGPKPACEGPPRHGSVEHGDGGRLIAGARRQEALQLLLRLKLAGRRLRPLQALRPPLRGQQRGDVRELLRLQG